MRAACPRAPGGSQTPGVFHSPTPRGTVSKLAPRLGLPLVAAPLQQITELGSWGVSGSFLGVYCNLESETLPVSFLSSAM